MSGRVATTDDQQRRADYLGEITGLLYPAGAQCGESVEYIAVPNIRHPRILVPAVSRRMAATALRQYARPASVSARLKRDLAVAALVSGVDRLALPDRITLVVGGDIGEYLAEALGTRVHLGIHIGPARANRKPVLQLLNSQSETIGFAKLGTNQLTRELVQAETDALRALSDTRLLHVRVPQILHAGSWRGHNVLVQEALPGWQRPARLNPARLMRAMRELAVCQGIEDTALCRSPYAVLLEKRLAVLSTRHNADATTLVEAARRLLDRHADHRLRFGTWHGDWSPWNMSIRSSTILLWDLERFCHDVPLGFDALHFALQRDIISRGADPTSAVLSLLAQAPVLLRPFGVGDSAARVTVLLYLVDLAARYLTDRQAEAGAALGALGRWLLPTLLRHVAAEGGVVQ